MNRRLKTLLVELMLGFPMVGVSARRDSIEISAGGATARRSAACCPISWAATYRAPSSL